jgi:hypothetical protein
MHALGPEDQSMSQRNVEKVIGVLATDEEMRRRFRTDPEGTLDFLIAQGLELTPCEFEGLRHLSARRLTHFAEALDPRLQKSDLKKGMA